MSEDVIKLEHVWKIFGENAQAAMEAIEARNLSKDQVLKEFKCVVGIADCSFSVRKGEVFCVMGLSGSGKSTMVRHLNRLIEPTAGFIEVLGKDMRALSDVDLRAMRAREIGMVFQHMALLPHRTVRDNVAFPLQIRGESKARRWDISQQCLNLVNLDGYEDMDKKTIDAVVDVPGYLGYDKFGDGNQNTFISYWKDLKSIDIWRKDFLHIEAKKHGKQWYKKMRIQIVQIHDDINYWS